MESAHSSEAYRTDGIVTDAGDIHATSLPFETGQRVELVVWPSRAHEPNGIRSQEEIARRLASLDGMVAWLKATRPKNLPHLSDEAISRDAIYEDRGL
jgi:hypothetical protein